MKYFIFKKEDDDFSEMLKDKTLKPLLNFKIKFNNHLILGSYDDIEPGLVSYLTIKYGENMVNKEHMFKDFSPKINIDYSPDSKRPLKFKNL